MKILEMIPTRVMETETELMTALDLINTDINKKNAFKKKYGMSFSLVRESILGGHIKPVVATFITNLSNN